MSAPPLVVLAAGGTGGHLFPAEALASVLAARGYRLALVTDRRGAAYGEALGRIDTHHLPVSPLGGTLAVRAKGAFELIQSYLLARRLLATLAPQVVIGFGGYPSLPTVLAAIHRGVATAIHEQNAVLGRANRLLAARVRAIATSFAQTRALRPREIARAVVTGNPVRPAVLALRERPYAAPALGDLLRLLVVGGSQGARIFGQVIPAAIGRLAARERARIAVTQQCRPEDIEPVRQAYRAAGVGAELATFFADLPERLAVAHLVVCRAGASTTAELTAAGRPAILVPYPHATDDHQAANAAAVAAAGGAWLETNDSFGADTLAQRLQALLDDATPLARMAAAARSLGRPDAAERLADLVAGLAPRSATISTEYARHGAGQPAGGRPSSERRVVA